MSERPGGVRDLSFGQRFGICLIVIAVVMLVASMPAWLPWVVGIGTFLSPIGLLIWLRVRYPAEWKR